RQVVSITKARPREPAHGRGLVAAPDGQSGFGYGSHSVQPAFGVREHASGSFLAGRLVSGRQVPPPMRQPRRIRSSGKKRRCTMIWQRRVEPGSTRALGWLRSRPNVESLESRRLLSSGPRADWNVMFSVTASNLDSQSAAYVNVLERMASQLPGTVN